MTVARSVVVVLAVSVVLSCFLITSGIGNENLENGMTFNHNYQYFYVLFLCFFSLVVVFCLLFEAIS